MLTGVVSGMSDRVMQPTLYACKCGTKTDFCCGSSPPHCSDCGSIELKPACFRTIQTFVLRSDTLCQKLCILTGSSCESLRPNQTVTLDVHTDIIQVADMAAYSEMMRAERPSQSQEELKFGKKTGHVTAYVVDRIVSDASPKTNDLEQMSKDALIHARLAGSIATDYPAEQLEKEALVLMLASVRDPNPLHMLLLGSERAAKMSLVYAAYDLARHKAHMTESSPSSIMSANNGLVVSELDHASNPELELLLFKRAFLLENIPMPIHVSVLAHAIPKKGVCDTSRPIHENVDFDRRLLDAFDLVCIIKNDTPSDNEPLDAPDGAHSLDLLSVQTCRDYLDFVADLEVHLNAESVDCIKRHYMRSQKTKNPLNLFNLVTLKKLALAKARVHYRPVATERDAAYAVRLFEYVRAAHVTKVSHGVSRS